MIGTPEYMSPEQVAGKIEKGIPYIEKVAPKRKPLTSREITVTFLNREYELVSSLVKNLVEKFPNYKWGFIQTLSTEWDK